MKKIFSNIQNHLQRLKRDIILLWQTPIEFIYSFTYPSNKFVKILPYDPEVTKLGEDIVNKIHAKYPELTVHFIGSAAFKIAGQKDIDFIIDCEPKNFSKYLPGLTKILGKPDKIRNDHIEWTTKKRDYTVNALLIDKNHPISKNTVGVCKKIAANKSLIKQYEKLKLSSNGQSFREYKRRRIAFFNRIISAS